MTAQRTTRRPRLLLVGWGAVHRHLLAAPRSLAATFDITVVAPERIGGGIEPATALDGRFSHPLGHAPPELVWHRERLAGLQTVHQRAILTNGQRIDYDLISLAIGTRRVPAFVGGSTARVYSGHSPADLRAMARQLGPSHSARRMLIVGGSPQALLVAEALMRRPDLRDGHTLTLLWPGDPLRHRSYRRRFKRLVQNDIALVRHVVPIEYAGHKLVAEDGRRFAGDCVLWAGPAAPAAAVESIAEGSGLAVDRHLRVRGTKTLFASGATAALAQTETVLPGRQAVAHAKVLQHNLLAMARRNGMRRIACPPVLVRAMHGSRA